MLAQRVTTGDLIQIGPSIFIKIESVRKAGGQAPEVRLGIEAPKELKISLQSLLASTTSLQTELNDV